MAVDWNKARIAVAKYEGVKAAAIELAIEIKAQEQRNEELRERTHSLRSELEGTEREIYNTIFGPHDERLSIVRGY